MVDTRGLSCPIPVVMVQKALKNAPARLEVVSDAQVAVENITRFAASQGYQVRVTPDGDEFKLLLTK